MKYAYVRGEIAPLEQARVSVTDRGFLYGDGVFETIRVRDRRCVRLDRHLARLADGLAVLGIAADFGTDPVDAIYSLIEANELTDARVRLTVTRGESDRPGYLGTAQAGPPTVVITAGPLPERVSTPAKVVTSTIRKDETSPLCGLKSLNYLPGVLSRAEAERAGADDAIVLNTQGCLVGGTVANVFVLMGQQLVTPSLDQGCLPGTVRGAIIALAPEIGLQVEERWVMVGEFAYADEVFFSNAIQLVRPVSHVDGQAVGDGHPTCERIVEVLLASEDVGSLSPKGGSTS